MSAADHAIGAPSSPIYPCIRRCNYAEDLWDADKMRDSMAGWTSEKPQQQQQQYQSAAAAVN